MSRLSRRSLLSASVAPLLLGSESAAALPAWRKLSAIPDNAVIWTEQGSEALERNGTSWKARDVLVSVAQNGNGRSFSLRAPQSAVMRIRFRWQLKPPTQARYLGDDWERSYGTLGWRGLEPERVLPWYFLAQQADGTVGCGVKTAAGAMCFWQVDTDGVSLWLDVRNGGRGVTPGTREIALATVVTEQYPGLAPFRAAQHFCKKLCDRPRLPTRPVYGGNNWYYAYGKSSAADIRADSERVASWASTTENRPWMVIDDGWSPNATAGPWLRGNERFPDMAGLANDMRRIGVQPGLWIRPLFTKAEIPAGWRLRTPNTLDPTVPDAQASIEDDVRRSVSWGYSLIKHDFSTYDLLGRWGFTMNAALTDPNWSFADRTKTNAEVIRDFYAALRRAAGGALLLGCNTVGHLGAGLFELQRTGDDTSGRDWNRTRKMGVNTLAFRGPQQGAFFAIDADCAGLTDQVPWTYNRQWLDLLSRSGTPLFVSAAPKAVGADQERALRAAFAIAARPLPTAEPLDWLTTNEPERWLLNGAQVTYDWFGSDGVNPLGT